MTAGRGLPPVPLVRDRPIRGPGVLGHPIRRAGAGFEHCPIRVRGPGALSSQSRGRARSRPPGRREALVCAFPPRRQVSSVRAALACARRAVTRRTPAEPGAALRDGECVGSRRHRERLVRTGRCRLGVARVPPPLPPHPGADPSFRPWPRGEVPASRPLHAWVWVLRVPG